MELAENYNTQETK